MLRRCAMVLGVVSFVASGIGSVSAETFYQVDFSSQANYSWPGSGALPVRTDWGRNARWHAVQHHVERRGRTGLEFGNRRQ